MMKLMVCMLSVLLPGCLSLTPVGLGSDLPSKPDAANVQEGPPDAMQPSSASDGGVLGSVSDAEAAEGADEDDEDDDDGTDTELSDEGADSESSDGEADEADTQDS